jgi:hypothetical protein
VPVRPPTDRRKHRSQPTAGLPAGYEVVLLIADHLDAGLAAGEDLLATRLAALADLDTAEDAVERELSRFVDRLERLETMLVGRILQARRRLEELPRHDAELAPLVRLFVASTDSMLDLVEHFGGQTAQRFDTGSDRLPFLRQRGLIARDAAGLPIYETLEVTESYRVGGLIELGPLMDLIATLLDVLDGRFDLYGAVDGIAAIAGADDFEDDAAGAGLGQDVAARSFGEPAVGPPAFELPTDDGAKGEPVSDDAAALHSPAPRL